jgi:hypothetical protein
MEHQCFVWVIEPGLTDWYPVGNSGTEGTSSLFRRLKTEATLRTLREMLRPRPRLVPLSLLEKVVAVVAVVAVVDGGLMRAGVTVAALWDLPITRTGSSAAVMVLRRRWLTLAEL